MNCPFPGMDPYLEHHVLCESLHARLIVAIANQLHEMKLVALIEVVSPTNKAAGPGRVSYQAKQRETLERDCHLIEIDLLRHGRHVVCVPEWRVDFLRPFDFLSCVNRWPARNRYELYPRSLRERLPRLKIPLADEDPDATLDLPAALEQVYIEGRYGRRIRYDQSCEPPLSLDDQTWANEQIATYRQM
jgi:Protein of unknown function (DUF4058)